MFDNFKASLLRMSEMSWESLTKLKAWMKIAASFNNFDVDNFNSPTLQIAQSCNEHGDPIVMCPVETCFLVSAYVVNPSSTQAEATRAGDYLDAEIARQATRAGVSKLLIAVPADHPSLQGDCWKEGRVVRIYERNIPNPVHLQGMSSTPSSQATQYLN